ncbi:TIGR03986 family type III CRISPR-associated RAMP protein [Succinimonas amylolytica]|uniref:TIGR03986 family type III CRISPR-associated RAMP protein n=1 Tax=Succinimonas amylolytica TaxID=83769 RepID=UPI000370053E|nr:TIGR03986 family CRISPR-associated RAMP protein [Succinimonas amylolytica]
MPEIIAPYSFVPLPGKVFAPDWAYCVSHDLPFPDGLDGVIDLELVNHGDICVGSGGDEESEDADSGGKKPREVWWARDPEDQDRLIIPGTSVKGMLRNVLEIVSLARLTPDSMYQIREFSYRVLEKGDYMNQYQKYDRARAWLRYDPAAKTWKLRKCKSKHGIIKIFDEELNKFLGLGADCGIKNYDPKAGFKQQSLEEKYEKARKSQKGLDLNTRVQVFLKTETPHRGQSYERVVRIVPAGSEGTSSAESSCTGYVVFSNFRVAEASDKDKKAFSYIFPDDEYEPEIEVSQDMVQDFTGVSDTAAKNFRYLLGHQNQELGIPVWAFTDKVDRKLKELGFAKMPRFKCRYNTEQVTARHQWGGDDKDWELADELYFSLPDLLFGTVRKQCGHLSIRSRIGCTDMVSEKVSSADFGEKMDIVLSSPKPSFTAMYLEDNKTYSSSTGIPRSSGFKRYRCQEKSTSGIPGKEPVISRLEVLRKPKAFSGRIKFHNLKREELGALLWCLRFGETLQDSAKSPFYHNIGHGKPYGLGAVQFRRIAVEVPDYDSFGMKRLDTAELDAMVRSFCELMDREFEKAGGGSNLWSTSAQVEMLRSLAVLHDDYVRDSRVYNAQGDFKHLNNARMPKIPRVQVIDGTAVTDPKDVIQRQNPADSQQLLTITGLNKKYCRYPEIDAMYQYLIKERGNDKYLKKCCDDLEEKKKELREQEKFNRISCAAIRDFISSEGYKQMSQISNCKAAGSLPVSGDKITAFLKEVEAAQELSETDKIVLDDILKSAWLKAYKEVKKNAAVRKKLVNDIREKHGLSET